MPRKTTPKENHQFHSIFATFNETLYSPEDVKELAALLGDGIDLDEFHERLERSADVYRIHKNNYDHGPTDPELKAALSQVLSDQFELVSV